MYRLSRLVTVIGTMAALAAGIDLDVHVGGGYGIPFGGNPAFSSDLLDNSFTPHQSEDTYLNLGKGVKLEAGVAAGVRDKLMVKLGFLASFLTGGEVETDVYDWDIGGVTGTTTSTRTYAAKIIGGHLQLVPQVELSDMVTVYCGLGGGVFYAFTDADVHVETVSTSGNSTTTTTATDIYEYENAPFVGLVSSLGVRFNVLDPLAVTVEVGYDAMNISPEQERHIADDGTTTVTKYEKDAHDRQAPTKTPASNVSLRAAFVFSIL